MCVCVCVCVNGLVLLAGSDIICFCHMCLSVVSMLVVMASTWLDFFPGRLVELKLRLVAV